MEKLKVHWVTPEYEGVANGYGYSLHNKMMKKFCEPYLEYDDTSNIALQIICGDKFYPVPGKFNVLFTMWEFLDVPNSYIKAFDKADLIIVPSSFCRKLFQKYTDKPIVTCWEGIDPDVYKFKQRRRPVKGERFKFLWVGAPNPRKGYPFILELIKILEKTENVELYIKTTFPKAGAKNIFDTIKKHWREIAFTTDEKGKKVRRSIGSMIRRTFKPYYEGRVMTLGQHKNIIFDTRRLPLSDLVKLYEDAHCFLMPTLGEGWGLTLCEAMATGCPAIATPVTGVTDFFDDTVGYPLTYSIYEQDLVENYGMKSRGYIPDTQSLVNQVIYVMNNYPEALKKGRKASSRILSKFTWQNSALRLAHILREHAVPKDGSLLPV